jgi:hypothetical protein
MKIAVRYEVPSLESDFIAEMLQAADEVVKLGPCDVGSHTEIYDLAVCVGPVRSRPLAKASVLIVLGPTYRHDNLEFDGVVTSCEAARGFAVQKFGHGTKVFKAPPPILGLVHGKRRMVEERKLWLTAIDGECGLESRGYPGDEAVMGVWDKGDARAFSPLEFNSLVKGGAVGFYPYMVDGYDVQVRRHLALGGRVVCERDRDVIGDLVDLVDDRGKLDKFGSIKPVGCVGRVEDYVSAIREIVEIWR